MSKVYALLAAIGGVLLAVLSAFKKGEKSGKAQVKAEAEEAARAYQEAGSEAMVTGLKAEQEIKNEKVNTTKRDHFN